MTETVITVTGISKKYVLGNQLQLTSVRDKIGSFSLKQAKRGTTSKARNDYWALKNVSFAVKRGEVVGIIGANGSGKSTLLKILAKIVVPSQGKAVLEGTVASLLEVGTGFSPELTGRENIYLNGAILGMKQKEISAKFDEIVNFAGVEQFIDTPVKRYSSGMYVRLAFAVAAHLESDILLVDEVLAVGDAEFQKKCLEKMNTLAHDGRTVLFVSHDLNAVKNLCPTCLLLQKGKLITYGPTLETIAAYVSGSENQYIDGNVFDFSKLTHRRGSGQVRLRKVYFENRDGERVLSIPQLDSCTLVFECWVKDVSKTSIIDLGFSLTDNAGMLLTSSYSSDTLRAVPDQKRKLVFRYQIDSLPFYPGTYPLGIRVVVDGNEADWPQETVASLEVTPSNKVPLKKGRQQPLLTLDGKWCV